MTAIFGVVLIHSSSAAFNAFSGRVGKGWLLCVVILSVAGCAVPLFMMLSGALLLKPNAPTVTLPAIARRVARVAVPLAFWSVLAVLYQAAGANKPPNWGQLLTSPAMYHLWFVYMIVGVYLLLPVLDAVFRYVIDRRDLQIYLLALWFVVVGVRSVIQIPTLALFQLDGLMTYGGYFLFGAVVVRAVRRRTPTAMWVLLAIGGVVATTVATVLLSARDGAATEFARYYFAPNVMVSAGAIFILMTRIRLPRPLQVFFAWASDLSFIAYFVHPVILDRVALVLSPFAKSVPAVLVAVLVASVTFVVALALAAALRKIPGSRTLLG